MSVTYNGETTSFSGRGTVNPDKLVIPGKDKLTPEERTAMLSIEQWCNNLKAPGGSGYTPPTDRLALSVAWPGTSAGTVGFGGATILENVGTSFTVGTNFIQNNADGVYSFSYVVSRNKTASTTVTDFSIGWFDNDSVLGGGGHGGVGLAPALRGPTFTLVNVAAELSFTYFFPAGDQHFFNVNPSATVPYNIVLSFQRIS